MPKATEHHTASRRALLAAVASAPIAALPALALASDANPDAKLLAHCRAALRQNAIVQAIVDEGRLLPPGITPASRDQEVWLEDAMDIESDLFEEVIETPAVTPEGRRAKADCLRIAFIRCVCDGRRPTIDTIDDDGEWHERLAWSLARDVLAEASA